MTVTPSLGEDAMSDQTNSSLDRICEEVLGGLAGQSNSDENPEDTREAIQYIAQACLHVFGDHCQLQDDTYFELLRNAIAMSRNPKLLAKWKPKISDPTGARRNVIVKDKCLWIKDAGTDFLRPLLPLSLRSRLSPKNAEQWRADYEESRRGWLDQASHMEQYMSLDLPPSGKATNHPRRIKGDPRHAKLIALHKTMKGGC